MYRWAQCNHKSALIVKGGRKEREEMGLAEVRKSAMLLPWKTEKKPEPRDLSSL